MTQGEVFNVTALGIAYFRHLQRDEIKGVIMTHNKSKACSVTEMRQRSKGITDYAIVRTAEAAEILSITRKHLHKLSKEPDFPRKVRIGTNAVGWKISDLEAWINSKMDGSVNSGGGNGEI